MSLFNLFRTKSKLENSTIQCPFCLQASPSSPELKKCSDPGCGQPLPVQYLKRYRDAPPLFLPMMGMPNAGKSNFLTAATVALVSGNQFWKDLDYWALTDETDEFIGAVEQRMRTGVLPKTTEAKAIKIAFVLQLLRLPRWGNRTCVLRDVPGEHFEKRQISKDQVPFVINAKTAFLFFDFNGGKETAGNKATTIAERNIDRVLKAYVMGLEENGVTFDKNHGRKVVIVLTKADQLDLPANLRNYLWEDEHWNVEDRKRFLTKGNQYFNDEAMALYMERLHRVSLELRDWIKSQPGGMGLLNAAEQTHQIELDFCMISSIPCGVQPVGQTFEPRGKWQEPLRILDPLYWALELNSEAVK